MGGDLDSVMITSPCALHLQALLPALEKKLIVLLEKPVETTVDKCAEMWKAYRNADFPPLAVGFVLRYTSFYGQVKKALDTGEIGDIRTIEAAEMLGIPLSTAYTRGWRRHSALSGPFILEKCSHDMDLMNWFAKARVRHVSSFGNRTYFLPRPEAATHCRDCPLQNDCRFSVERFRPKNPDQRFIDYVKTNPDYDLCVFNSDKDILDNQVISLEYENDILVTFTATMCQPRTARTIKVNGTDGQVVGDIGRDSLRVVHDAVTDTYSLGTYDTEQTRPIIHDGSGHHGGDTVISNQYKAMLRGEETPPLAGLREGIDASLLALAAQESVEQQRTIDMAPIYQKVYGPDL